MRCTTIVGGKSPVLLDTVLIDAESLHLAGDISYSFNEYAQTITINQDDTDSVEVCYRVLSPVLTRPYFNRNISIYDRVGSDKQQAISERQEALVEDNLLFSTPGLYKSGSITRGITVGNRQNVFVNSNLNLILNGKLTEDLSISAVVTDQNIPYQPEGNTQQLRDFDNVFIKLYNESLNLTVGDIVLTNPVSDGYFLKYYKNVQGGSLSYNAALKNKWESKSQIAASAAKGRFASISVGPIEGVQGPYRLTGPNGERFIIVLANSERIFIDGKQLTRGFQNDYVIDYNLGEVTFNTNILITRFTRIRVDFEFVEQNYGRSNLSISQSIENENSKYYFTFYREKDNPNNTLGFDLSRSALDQLATLGDNTQNPFVSGVDSIGYFPERILYAKRDTVLSGQILEFFINSQDPDEALFNVRFTQLGQGLGDYELLSGTANGRVFEWVAPVAGVQQGSYAPVVQLSTPNQRQMMVLGSETAVGKLKFSQETAISNRDENLFSEVDEGDDNGYAWKGSITADSIASILGYRLTLSTDFEYNQRDFQAIDRFRYIEFDRDWSYMEDTLRQDQFLTGIRFGVYKGARKNYNYELLNRNRPGQFNGWQQKLTFSESLGQLRVSGNYFLLDNEQSQTEASWNRTDTDFQWRNNTLIPGYEFISDQNEVRSLGSDSVLRSAMYFSQHKFYVQSPDSSSLKYRLAYSKRADQLPLDGRLENFTEADNINLLMSHQGSGQNFQLDFNYRYIQDFINDENTDQVQGRVVGINSLFDDHLRSNLSLAISNGRELQREFIFIQVQTGEGTHTWRDENNDGVQDLNEFYEAINQDEKQYIKLFVPTDQYITAFRNQYNHTIDLSMPRSWRNDGGIKKMLSKVSYLVNWNLDNKTSNNSLNTRLNPFSSFKFDDEVISRRNRTRYGFFYNRATSGFGVEVARIDNSSRQLLTNGFEERNENSWLSNFRMDFGGVYILALEGRTGQLLNNSDFLESRNFNLDVSDWGPAFTWQPSNSFRVISSYKNSRKTNMNAEGERSQSDEWSVQWTYARASKSNLNLRLSLIDIDFEGEVNSFLGYTLLNALQPGTNFTTNFNWQQTLNKGLQLTIQYFGRKSMTDRFVHTGTFQLTAFF